LAAGGIEDEDGAILRLGPFQGILGDFYEVLFGGVRGVAGDADLIGKLGELVDGGGAVEVERDEEGAAAFLLQTEGELGGGGGLSGSIQPAEEDVAGGVEIDGRLVSAEEVGELVLEDFDDLLAGLDRFYDVGSLGFDGDVGEEIFHHAELDIGLEEGEADVAECLGDIFVRDFSDAAEVTESFVEAIREI